MKILVIISFHFCMSKTKESNGMSVILDNNPLLADNTKKFVVFCGISILFVILATGFVLGGQIPQGCLQSLYV